MCIRDRLTLEFLLLLLLFLWSYKLVFHSLFVIQSYHNPLAMINFCLLYTSTGVPYRSQWYYDWSCGTGLSQNWHNGKKGLLTAWKQRVSFHDLLWWWRHTLLSVYGTIGSWIRQLRLCILRMSDHHIRSLRSYLFQDQWHIHEIRCV